MEEREKQTKKNNQKESMQTDGKINKNNNGKKHTGKTQQKKNKNIQNEKNKVEKKQQENKKRKEENTVTTIKETHKEKTDKEGKKDVVENYVADIFNTPYAKQSIQNAVHKKKDLEETAEFTETIVSEEIKQKLQEMKNRQNNPEIETIVPPKEKHGLLFVRLLIIIALAAFILYHFTTYNHEIKEKIIVKEKIVEKMDTNYVFLGDSITEQYDLKKHFKQQNIINSGHSGNIAKDIVNNMQKRVYDYNPSHVFLLIGANDVLRDIPQNEIIDNIKTIIKGLQKNRPLASLHVESIYPTGNKEKNEVIIKINKEIEKFCKEENIYYIDIYKDLVDKDNILDKKYSEDGLHINDDGYRIITKRLNKYITEKK